MSDLRQRIIELKEQSYLTGSEYAVVDSVNGGTAKISIDKLRGAQGPQGEKGDSGVDAILLKIDSSNGTMFRANQVSTDLTIAIYSGSSRITNIVDLRTVFGTSARIVWYWKRQGETNYHLIPSTDSKISEGGFKLTLTPEEVDNKITFMAQLEM